MSDENNTSKKIKKQLTDKQRTARLKNLEEGRKKRMENLRQKQEAKEEVYDLSSGYESDDDSLSDSEAFIISKAKKKGLDKPVKPKEKSQQDKPDNTHQLKSEVDELKYLVYSLANLQKKQHKRKQPAKQSGTKIVVLPQAASAQTKSSNDSIMEALRRSLM